MDFAGQRSLQVIRGGAAAGVDFSQAYLDITYSRSLGENFTWGVSLVAVATVTLCSCEGSTWQWGKPADTYVAQDDAAPGDAPTTQQEASGAIDDKPVVVMETSMGTITIELNRPKAPITVKNFLRYVDNGFYDGTTFL